jgi:hypothetical protein
LGGPKIRFYAGAPLIAPSGEVLGTICAIDTVPRELTEKQQRALQIISNQVVTQMELKKHVEDLKKTVQDLQIVQQNLILEKEYAENASISSFGNLLLSQNGAEAFYRFLMDEFCAENFEFWLEAKNYRDSYNTMLSEERESFAKPLAEVYVKDAGIKEVNLLDSTRLAIMDAITHNKFDLEILDVGRKEAFILMKKDSYPRFLSSPHYRHLLTEIKLIGLVRLQAHENS